MYTRGQRIADIQHWLSTSGLVVPATTVCYHAHDNILKKMEECLFFDDTIKSDMFFLTVHDAVLYIASQRKYKDGHDPLMDKISLMQDSKEPLEFANMEPKFDELDAQEESLRILAS
ncbi:hypothetical protein FKM82_023623 [Ascaphus truei]